MDTDELHKQLSEIAATASVDPSADRVGIESRARLYRRHRRRVASCVVALGIAGLLVILISLTTGGDASQSVRVPPAQQHNGALSQGTSLTKCLTQQAELGQRNNWPAGTISMFDEGTHTTAALPIETYCEQAVALEAAFFSDHPNENISIYLENGVLKARSGGPVVTNPIGAPPTNESPSSVPPSGTPIVNGTRGGAPPCATDNTGSLPADPEHPQGAPLQATRDFGNGTRWAICGASVALSSDLLNLRSSDNGATWSVSATPIRFSPHHSGDRIDVQFESPTTARISLTSLVGPQSNATFTTQDGGTTWNRAS